MKPQIKNLMPVVVLLIAAGSAFASRSNENRIVHDCTWFVYTAAQSMGNPATVAQARTKANWTYYQGPAESIKSFVCTSTNYLCAICVPASEIDNNGTPNSPVDDKPKVDDNTTTIYADLADPDAISPAGFWTDVGHPNINNHIESRTVPF